jgi:pilus assembly protein CpaE
MKKDYRILAVTRSSESESEIKAAAADLDGGSVDYRIDRLADVAPTIVNSHVPDVLLIELGLQDPDEVRHLSRLIRENAGRMAVLATGRDVSLEDARMMMRLGVSDFIPRPVTPADLTAAVETAVERLHPSAPREAQGGSVVTFLRASGGVGATTLAIETAARFLVQRKREKPRVCILDFDLQFGNAALSLDLTATTGIDHVLEAEGRVDDDFLLGSMARHASGIEVLAAPGQILPLDAMTPEMTGRIVQFARAHYDYAIIDMPYAWTGWTLDVVARSDMVVVVTELDVTSIARTRRQLDLLDASHIEGVPVVVMLNRHRARWSMRGRRKEAEKALGRPFDFVIGWDGATAAAARDRGVLVSHLHRRSPIVKGLTRFVQDSGPTLHREGRLATRRTLLGGVIGG